MNEDMNDERAEALLTGEDADGPLGATLSSMRRTLSESPAPAPGAALSEFVSTDLLATYVAEASPSTNPVKERKMNISAFVGTVAGKILIGATVAAASVGGVQASGVADIPGVDVLPFVDDHSEEVVDESYDSDDESSDSADHDETDDSSDVDHADSPDSPDSVDDADSDDDDSEDDDSDDASEDVFVVIDARTFDVAGVGTVTVEGDSDAGLSVTGTTAADGWTASIDTEGSGDAEVTFRSDEGDEEVEFEAEIDDGALRVRVRDSRAADSDHEAWYDESGNVIDAPLSDDESDEVDEADEADEAEETDEPDDESDQDGSDSDSSDDESEDEEELELEESKDPEETEPTETIDSTDS